MVSNRSVKIADLIGDMTHQLLSGADLDKKTLASSLAHSERTEDIVVF